MPPSCRLPRSMDTGFQPGLQNSGIEKQATASEAEQRAPVRFVLLPLRGLKRDNSGMDNSRHGPTGTKKSDLLVVTMFDFTGCTITKKMFKVKYRFLCKMNLNLKMSFDVVEQALLAIIILRQDFYKLFLMENGTVWPFVLVKVKK